MSLADKPAFPSSVKDLIREFKIEDSTQAARDKRFISELWNLCRRHEMWVFDETPDFTDLMDTVIDRAMMAPIWDGPEPSLSEGLADSILGAGIRKFMEKQLLDKASDLITEVRHENEAEAEDIWDEPVDRDRKAFAKSTRDIVAESALIAAGGRR